MVAAGGVAAAWVVFLAIDIFGLVQLPVGHRAWRALFNDRSVEWAQCLLQGAAILFAGFIAGRLTREEDQGLRAFLLVLGGGLALMLFEDAGDARHVISGYVETAFGASVLGLPYRVVSDVPYLLVIAALPVYAVLRYGTHAWRAPQPGPTSSSASACTPSSGEGPASGTSAACTAASDPSSTVPCSVDAFPSPRR